MDRQTYKEQREAIETEQKNMAYQEVKDAMEKRNEHIAELDNLPKQNHIWVDRGAVMSCEGAAHANHRAFKRLR